MKIVANKILFESILTNLQNFLEKKDASQITSHLFIKAKENGCIIKATDGEIGLLIETDNIIIEEEGVITANGKRLLDIIRILRDEDVILEKIDNNLHIRQNKSKFKLPIFNFKNFPSFPIIENKSKISLDSIKLINALKNISSSIDSNNPKYELNGALLNIKNQKTELVGTDTRRLSVVTIENKSEKELSLIIPKKAIIEIQKLFIDDIDIYYDETSLIIKNRNFYFFTRLINGNFPNYERIIPSTSRYTITLPKKEMLESIKMITTISQEIKITFTKESLLFNSLATDNIEAKTELLIPTGLGEDFEINVNSRFLLDFISQIESDLFKISLNEPTLPFVLKNKQFITVIMPIIV
ncbi:DNA polymerase III beta subunit [hydrothermal vent metagenome]|uniref:DNA polymerase III beta subunit n=1 Tax=hydrothermal vent metagenome TaxID=652676 RepID=A0A1W1BMA7_9ZZZZ